VLVTVFNFQLICSNIHVVMLEFVLIWTSRLDEFQLYVWNKMKLCGFLHWLLH